MRKSNTANILIDAMIEHQISHLFFLRGVQNGDFFDSLYDRSTKLKPIHTQHEQGSLYMALSAAMATGKPQAFCAVPGSGILTQPCALLFSSMRTSYNWQNKCRLEQLERDMVYCMKSPTNLLLCKD